MKKYSFKLLCVSISFSLLSITTFAIDVSVKEFGAKGDGKTDDRLSIQAAIDAVNKAGGGVVNFPEGIYIVNAPNKGNWEPQIKLYNNLKLNGEGMYKSIIKVADNQGAWDVILKGDSINRFSMLDLAIDGNGGTNPVLSSADGVRSPYLHTLVYLPKAKNVAIERCRFTNLSGVWAIYALRRAENVLIDGCLFDNIGGYTKNDWDHSCIRIDGYGPVIVSNNIMTSRLGAGTTGARTAVEIHGSNHKFINNTMTGFRYGINVCSGGDEKTTEPSVHQYYIGNKFVNVGCGFSIWGIRNKKFDNLVFERNDITIDITAWRRFFPEFYGIGIVTYKGQTPPLLMENVRIVDNQITYINSDGGNDRSSGIRLDFSIYTDKWSENPAGELVNCQILRNTISGSYMAAIYMNCVGKNIEIADNTFIDAARGAQSDDWRCGIKLADNVSGLKILNNAFYTHNSNGIKYGIYDGANSSGNCVQMNNRISGTGVSVIPIYFAGPERKGQEWKNH